MKLKYFKFIFINILGFVSLGSFLSAETLVYSTFLGGSNYDSGLGIALDSAGNVYITGYTSSSNFPSTLGSVDTTYNGGVCDIFISKLNSEGSALIYSTFIGGGSDDYGRGITLDNSGNVYIIGETHSPDFPTTPGAFDTTFNGASDGFVSKLNVDGSYLIYSTFLGGMGWDYCYAIALDSAGNAYVTGSAWSSNFPTTPGSFDTTYNGSEDAFVSKINTDGSILTYSTFLGGSNYNYGYGITVDSIGNAYITGYTESPDFPTTLGAFDTTYNGQLDIFVSKLNTNGSALIFSTFVGGGDPEYGRGITLDSAGNAYVTGFTYSSNFPTTFGAFDTTFNGARDSFVIKLNSIGSALIYGTFLGGGNNDYSRGIVLDNAGNAFITGYTLSLDFPITPSAFDTSYNSSGEDVFVSKLNPEGSTLLYSTYLGGIGADYSFSITADAIGNIYIAGATLSTDFPTTPSAFDTTFNGGSIDAFVSKLDLAPTKIDKLHWLFYE